MIIKKVNKEKRYKIILIRTCKFNKKIQVINSMNKEIKKKMKI